MEANDRADHALLRTDCVLISRARDVLGSIIFLPFLALGDRGASGVGVAGSLRSNFLNGSSPITDVTQQRMYFCSAVIIP